MNSVRHKWLTTVAKTYFASCETHPLGVIFWTCELYLSLFWFLANPLGMILELGQHCDVNRFEIPWMAWIRSCKNIFK